MGTRLETARDYVGSVLSRTLGINGFRETYQDYTIDQYSKPGGKIKRIHNSFITGMLQIIYPAGCDAIHRAYDPGEKSNSPTKLILEVAGAIAADWASLLVVAPAVAHDPVSFALYKVGYNVVAHVGMDVLEAGITRLRGFRPQTAATLAV